MSVTPLHQVLEEEYDLLHGPLAPGSSLPPAADKAEEETRLKRLFAIVHHLKDKRSALCLSGGGIRSASYGLGVLQGLARHGLLDKFHCLSTVSGGGYIGSWLSASIRRKGMDAVLPELIGKPPKSPRSPEPRSLQHIRRFSNYLTPRTGLLSVDTMALVALYIRNLILNWFMFLPVLLAVVSIPLLIEALYEAWYSVSPTVGQKVPTVLLVASVLVLGVFLAGLSLIHIDWGKPGRKWLYALFISAWSALLYGWGWDASPWTFAVVNIGFIYSAVCISWLCRPGQQTSKTSAGSFSLAVIGLAVGVPFAGILIGTGAWAMFRLVLPQLTSGAFAALAVPFVLVTYLLAGAITIGAISRWTSDEDREYWARSSAWTLMAIVIWALIGGLVIFGSDLLRAWWDRVHQPSGLQEMIGLSSAVLAVVSGGLTLWLGASGQTSAQANDAKTSPSPLKNIVLALAAPLFAAFIICLLAIAAREVIDVVRTVLGPLSKQDEAMMMGVMIPGWFVLGIGAAWLVNVNKFSLHGIYRDRLARAYLGASRKAQRRPDSFTGFDANDGNGVDTPDNIYMHHLLPDDKKQGMRLFHILNIALNLVDADDPAWQERKAESFTVSPMHCGNYRLGYRRANEYGGSGDFLPIPITLGTALTISGAAVSPNSGYHSSPFVTFLMTLFNLRLGWWLGNPGWAGEKTYRFSKPRISLLPLLWEAMGRTNDRNSYVYLSDGGHFDNLGLYEMVLRRCHFIVVIDAGRDPACAFDDLGNAIRKIRIDLGVPIEMRSMQIYSRESKQLGKYCAIGDVKYQDVDGAEAPNGILIYLKPCVYEGEPTDIYNYAKSNPGFPHESTGDQWFSESQLESYRMLGSHTINQLCRDDWEERMAQKAPHETALDVFHAQADRYLDEPRFIQQVRDAIHMITETRS